MRAAVESSRATAGAPPSAGTGLPQQGRLWTVLQLIRWCTEYLRSRGIEDGRLDVELLLAETLGMDRLSLYLHFDRPVAQEELKEFKPGFLERAGRKPLQYILGKASFRDVEVAVDPRVLIPRPETEELVEAVLGWARERGSQGEAQLRALDIGTGSGVIAIALALEGPFAKVVATDLSPEALEVARGNVARCGVAARVEVREGAYFVPVAPGESFDVVVSNPPYVTAAEYEVLPAEIRGWEPKEALVADDGGLGAIRALVEGARSVLRPGGLLAMEIGAGQGKEVLDLLQGTRGYETPALLKDHSRRDRIVLAVRN